VDELINAHVMDYIPGAELWVTYCTVNVGTFATFMKSYRGLPNKKEPPLTETRIDK
jgi:hypothetical protein